MSSYKSSNDLPSWANDYIGLPFDQINCYNLCRKVYQERYNISLPNLDEEYQSALDIRRIARLFAREMATRFKQVVNPYEGCLVSFRVRGQLWHCGIYLTSKYFLHTYKQGMNSCIDRFDSIYWNSKITGYFCYVAKS